MDLDKVIDCMPRVPMAMVTNLPLERDHWISMAMRCSYQTLRMNLATFHRHGVFCNDAVNAPIARRLTNRELIAKSGVQPFQLMMAYRMSDLLPGVVRAALKEAMEIATMNVPRIDGQVRVLLDVSGSMHGALTGYRKGATSMVRCLDVAALIAASILRKNAWAKVIAFNDRVVPCELSRKEGILAMAAMLAALPQGGTDCSAPLRHLNDLEEPVDLVIMVSDNQSWMGKASGATTATHAQWLRLKERCPEARMVCIDLQPYPDAQVPDRPDVMNIGGYSDAIFERIERFAREGHHAGNWVEAIEAVMI
jgi:60 kDa SS-A/Ro ribonucleoprotein